MYPRELHAIRGPGVPKCHTLQPLRTPSYPLSNRSERLLSFPVPTALPDHPDPDRAALAAFGSGHRAFVVRFNPAAPLSRAMTLYDRVADLPVSIDSIDFERHEMDTSAGFTRVSTVVELHGADDADGSNAAGSAGAVGRGEDVTYETADQEALLAAHTDGTLDWDLTGEFTLDSFSAHLDDQDLFPEPPEQETFRHYRRWAVESAALDLALRQADTDFAAALGRSYDPVEFVVSTRLDTGDAPSADRVEKWLAVDPTLAFKLDPTPAWSDDLLDALAATDSVRILDFKAYYEGTDVDQAPDPDLYRRVAAAFPEAILEDAKITDETRDALAGTEARLSWDYPVTGVESVRELPVDPEWLNIKPSRFGTVESLLATVEYCLEAGITMYGGGQYELDVGRQHLHALASTFYPDSPNDVAPRAYNVPEPHADVPASPLDPPADPAGLGWQFR